MRIIYLLVSFVTAIALTGCVGTLGLTGITYQPNKFDNRPIGDVIKVLGKPSSKENLDNGQVAYIWHDQFEQDKTQFSGHSITQTSSGLAQVNNHETIRYMYACKTTVITKNGIVISSTLKTTEGNGLFNAGGCRRTGKHFYDY